MQDGAAGRGECVPYARYGETVEGVIATIEGVRGALESGLDRQALQEALPPGAARNAIDCALWDLEAKRTGVPAYVAAGLDRVRPATTAYTISLDTPDAMAAAAAKAAERPILKIKLGAPDGDLERIAAVRAAAPDATLIADANEGWTNERLETHLAACAAAASPSSSSRFRRGVTAPCGTLPARWRSAPTRASTDATPSTSSSGSTTP
jgi:L-alanine-DL-glutamate epimerase-like enolase superfamily enzyme